MLDDPKLRHFTPYEELESRASRRGSGGAGWLRDEEHVFYKHARFVADLVTAGKLADILVFDESPLEGIRNSTAISPIMKNGRLYDGHTLDEIYPRQRPLPGFFWQNQVPETGGVGTAR